MSDKTGSCPHCGESTKGQLIAGTVYDFQCDRCCDEIDANFRSFIDALISGELDTRRSPAALAGHTEGDVT